MTSTLEEFRAKFKTVELEIVKLNYWTWSLRPTHSTLGSGVLSLNRFCTSFSAITSEEAEELSQITKEIESRLKTAFKPDKFNYVMLMMVDAHLHFHVIPRYGSEREFGAHRWKDSGWPALPALGESPEFVNSEILEEVASTLKNS